MAIGHSLNSYEKAMCTNQDLFDYFCGLIAVNRGLIKLDKKSLGNIKLPKHFSVYHITFQQFLALY